VTYFVAVCFLTRGIIINIFEMLSDKLAKSRMVQVIVFPHSPPPPTRLPGVVLN
jgi:hypothetical protein